jgi:hypothetical protein
MCEGINVSDLVVDVGDWTTGTCVSVHVIDIGCRVTRYSVGPLARAFDCIVVAKVRRYFGLRTHNASATNNGLQRPRGWCD